MQSDHPLRITLLFALISGLSMIPASLIFESPFARSAAIGLTLWLLVAAYGWLLARWGKKRPMLLFFPLLLLFLSVFTTRSTALFLPIALVTLIWIRSGICFTLSLGKMLAVENLICMGGGLLTASLGNDSAASWALGIWMFFLIQSLYFILVDTSNLQVTTPFQISGSDAEDPFEEARASAERILGEG